MGLSERGEEGEVGCLFVFREEGKVVWEVSSFSLFLFVCGRETS